MVMNRVFALLSLTVAVDDVDVVVVVVVFSYFESVSYTHLTLPTILLV